MSPKEAPWIALLRDRSTATEAHPQRSRTATAKLLSLSLTTISQVLNGKYPGNLDRIKERVLGAFMDETHSCPVLGTINKLRCQQEQDRPLQLTNSLRAQLYKACRSGCPHSKHAKLYDNPMARRAPLPVKSRA